MPVPPRFLQRIRELCDQHGIVMIADEVQCGCGRTGRMFAVEHYGIVPDMIVTAKSLGAGMPIGAVTGRAEIMDSAHLGGVGSTYGGSPVACAAALEALKMIRQPEFLAHANHLGSVMREVLESWKARWPVVGDVRGLGPMLLVELVTSRESKDAAGARRYAAHHPSRCGKRRSADTRRTFQQLHPVSASAQHAGGHAARRAGSSGPRDRSQRYGERRGGSRRCGTMNYIYQQSIGGEWRAASNGGTWDVLNPATEEVVRTVPFGNAEDCRLAIDAAHAAFPRWSQKTAYERAACLKLAAELIRQRSSDLARTTVLESGKPLVQAKGEWGVAADLFDWFAEEAKRAYGRWVPSRNAAKRELVIKQPLGVVGLITAWNFPAYNVARAGAAALAAGCTIVMRPSEFTPLTAMEMVNILLEAGLGGGEVNLINGEPESMGQEMLRNPKCAKIHFTGSPRVGKLLMDGASKTVKRLSLELGGNAPVLIFPDVDLEQVAASAVTAKFRNGGQVCISPQRFFVHDCRCRRSSRTVRRRWFPSSARKRAGAGVERRAAHQCAAAGSRGRDGGGCAQRRRGRLHRRKTSG